MWLCILHFLSVHFSQLAGVNEPVTLQVFVGIDQGKVRPHGYYQSCKVTGRNTTPCEEKDVDGTTVLEVPWEPTDGKMELRLVSSSTYLWKHMIWLSAGYVHSFAQLVWKSMAGSVAIVPGLNNGKYQHPNP